MTSTNLGQEVPSLDQLKKLFGAIKTSFDKNLEDTACLLQFNQLMQFLCDSNVSGLKVLEDDQAKFVYEELIPGVAKRVLATVTKNTAFALLISETLSAITNLFQATLQSDGSTKNERLSDLADTMRFVWDSQQKFYQFHFQHELGGDAGKALAITNFSNFSPDEINWRQNLTVDTLLDAFKIDESFKLSMWSIGKVIECFKDPKSGRLATIRIKFLHDISVKEISVPIDSENIAPLGTKREPDEWRASLKKGDVIDAMDRCSQWYEATVIAGEDRAECLMPMIKVGFRQYHSSGPKSDDMGTYFGLSSTADEHIGAYTVRIQKAYSHSKKGNSSVTQTTAVTSSAEQYSISYFNQEQDKADLQMLSSPQETIYATERMRCKSTVFVAMINQFGIQNGFDKILATIQHESTNIDLIYYLLASIGGCSDILHKSLIDKFFEPLWLAVQSKVLNSTEQQLRTIKRERIQEIVNAMWDKIMARLMTYFDAQVQKQVFNMNIGVFFLKQKLMERRIDGAKLIDHVCKQATGANLKQQLVSELTKHEVINEFFSKERCHHQLVQRSEQLLKLMIGEGALTQDQLTMIWESCRSDESLLFALYKVLAEIAGVGTTELQFFVDKITSKSLDTVRVQEIDLLEQIGNKIQSKTTVDPTVSSILEYYWRILFAPEDAVQVVAMQQHIQRVRQHRDQDLPSLF